MNYMIGLLPASQAFPARVLIEFFEEHIRIPWPSAFLMKILNELRSSDLLKESLKTFRCKYLVGKKKFQRDCRILPKL